MTELLERITLAWVLNLLRGIFRRKRGSPIEAVVHEPAPEPAIAQPVCETPAVEKKPIRRPKATKTQTRPDAESFSDLLDGLDESFGTMKIPAMKGNWLERKQIEALHKLGVYVPVPWRLEWPDDARIPQDEPLPTMASAYFCGHKYDEPNKVHARFVFAIREPRLPPGVEVMQGTPYRFGYCVQLCEKEHDPSSDPRMFWVWGWFVVGRDGLIRVPVELRRCDTVIYKRRPTPGSKGQRWSRMESVHAWQRKRPAIVDADEFQTSDEREEYLKVTLRQLILWWNRRQDQWSVGVRKDGKRVTFCIPKEHTAAYFADRQKVAAVNGTAKKIIHFVREHTRENGQTVRAHVRGLREFSWRGFDCFVTAPRLNGAVVTPCPVGPQEIPRAEAKRNRDAYLDSVELAVKLADTEDYVSWRTAEGPPAVARV